MREGSGGGPQQTLMGLLTVRRLTKNAESDGYVDGASVFEYKIGMVKAEARRGEAMRIWK